MLLMGRTGAKVKKGGLGNALMRTQKKTSSTNTKDVASSAGKHVSERDGGDASVALASFLEGSSLDDFLASAVLANRAFKAEKENVLLIHEADAGPQVVENNKQVMPEMTFAEMKVPRRPLWDQSTTAEELNRLEKEKFMEWRRDIAMLEASSDHGEVTPFEKNLEVWRQLWHVRERSDIVVQIVDARNPLFYRSTDLDAYAKEGEMLRRTLLIVNKSDFLNEHQRIAWGDHFTKENIKFVFFSAKEAQDEIDGEAKKLRQEQKNTVRHDQYKESKKPADAPRNVGESVVTATQETSVYPVLSRIKLLEYFTNIATEVRNEVGVRVKDKGLIKFGMVGFPNVGKSSVINALLGASTYSHKTQRVAVGATPGKTKHFQTMILSDQIMLCDCPGLVFPSFVNSKAEMYCCGVLPISQLRDHISPCQLLCHRIPKRVFERTYGIKIAVSKMAKETDPVGIYALLEAYARNRGYTTTGKGGPDTSRAARDILQHYVKGRLLYCHPPPKVSDPAIFDIHELAKFQFPDLEDPCDLEITQDERVEKTSPSLEPPEIEELDFDTTVVDKHVLSKRLKKHGRKGRKGRDKNPYEDSDFPNGVVGVHVNSGSKKKNRRP